jgi:hypothetical protein
MPAWKSPPHTHRAKTRKLEVTKIIVNYFVNNADVHYASQFQYAVAPLQHWLSPALLLPFHAKKTSRSFRPPRLSGEAEPFNRKNSQLYN